MPIHDECQVRCTEIENLLHEADERWRLLQVRLEEAEEEFLESKLDSLKKWFNLEEIELQNLSVGSVRHSIRDRIQRIVVQPLLDKMSQRVGFVVSHEETPDGVRANSGAAESKPPSLMKELLRYWEIRAVPLISSAKEEDGKLQKKIRKTEKDENKQGIIALTGDTKKVAALKRQRPAIWEPVQSVLETLSVPMKKLAAFFADEMSQDMVVRMINSVPAIVSRTLCDWYFVRCQLDLDQLEHWWKNTRVTLQQKERIWEELKAQEARLIRNVEFGLEDLNNRRQRYSMYATFGGSEIEILREISSQRLEESVTLLATVVSEMHKRLRMIRDSALWRIVESVQSIHKRHKAEAADVEAWPTVGSEEGVLALAEAIGCPCGEESSPSNSSSAPLSSEDIEDGATVVMGRLQKLVGVSIDIKDYFAKARLADCEGIAQAMDAVVSIVSHVNEELLSLLDDPSSETLRYWLEQWARIAEADRGHRIETTMAALSLPRDVDLSVEVRTARRRWLALLRGMQVLLNQDAVRAWAVSPLAEAEPGSPSSWKPCLESSTASPLATSREVDLEDLNLTTPPSPRGVLLAAPGGGYPYRPPERRSLTDGAGVDEGTAGVPMRTDGSSAIGEIEMTGDSGRPGTPAKFVDGKFVTVRPGSATTKLPPISPKSMAQSTVAF